MKNGKMYSLYHVVLECINMTW